MRCVNGLSRTHNNILSIEHQLLASIVGSNNNVSCSHDRLHTPDRSIPTSESHIVVLQNPTGELSSTNNDLNNKVSDLAEMPCFIKTNPISWRDNVSYYKTIYMLGMQSCTAFVLHTQRLCPFPQVAKCVLHEVLTN